MIEPFEVYRLYLAIKLHFTTKNYDIVKYRFKVRVKEETFRKRKEKEKQPGIPKGTLNGTC